MVVLGPTVFDMGSDFHTGSDLSHFYTCPAKSCEGAWGALRSNVLHKLGFSFRVQKGFCGSNIP